MRNLASNLDLSHKTLGTARRFALLIVLCLTLVSGCAERTEEPGLLIHPVAWNQVDEADFHGAYVRERAIDTCTVCHEIDGTGTDDVPGCMNCHDGPGGHSSGWVSPSAHGAEAATDAGLACTDCHGRELTGGWAAVSCFTCHEGPSGHPSGWTAPSFAPGGCMTGPTRPS